MFQVLADGGLGKGENIDNLPTHTGIHIYEVFYDFDPGGMSQRFEDLCKFFSVHLNVFPFIYRLSAINDK